MADDDGLPLWRLRESQQLLDWLRRDAGTLIHAALIQAWLESKSGPWWLLLRQAADEYALETASAELPRQHFIEWFFEWGREARKRQSALLLTTAHRAKGLEFDHVAVLDDDWGRVGENEDPDAPRRLYYVAMTRARQTLLLARRNKQPHPFLDALPDSDNLLRRDDTHLTPAAAPEPALQRQYLRLRLSDVYIDYAGRRTPHDALHGALAALSVGDALQLVETGLGWELHAAQPSHSLPASQTCKPLVLGKLAKTFVLPAGMRCVSARVHAMLLRRRDDVDTAFQDSLRCESWEVLLPELVLEPGRVGSEQG
jgi:ATP-dependent DNA helicase RecQ